MKNILIVALFLLASSTNFAQGLKFVQGELLIKLGIDRDLEILNENLHSEYPTETMELEWLIKMPMKIVRLKFDHNQIHEGRLLNFVKSHPLVEMAQFNHLIEERLIPDDPRYLQQWQYFQDITAGSNFDADIDADEAWEYTTGGFTVHGDEIVSCIIDDGIDQNHEDFGDNLWVNLAEIPNNGIDDDENGYIDDFNGWDTYNDDDFIFRDGSHGTPVAGIVGAQGNNGIGVTGVNWDVKLMIVRGGGNEANALAAYAYPYYFRKLYNDTDGAEGAFVVSTNASWGVDFGQPNDAPIWCSFYDSLGVVGILSCGATANIGIDIDVEGDLPTGCSSDYLIAVTNVNQDDEKVASAGWGIETIDLGAFGANTFTPQSGNGYGGFGGTSGATPHVTGAIALMYSSDCDNFINLAKTDPGSAALFCRQLILDGVDPNETLEGITATGGRLNVRAPIENLLGSCTDCPLISEYELSYPELQMVEIDWQNPDDVSAVNVRYKSDFSNWDTLYQVSNPFIIDGLENCTRYRLQFQSSCDTVENIFLGNASFRTDGCCEFVENESPEYEILDEELIVNIPNIAIASNYTLEFRNALDEEWTVQESIEPGTLSLGQLDICASYQIRLTVSCEENIEFIYNLDNITTDCDNCSLFEYCLPDPVDSEFEWIQQVTFNGEEFISGNNDGLGDFVGLKSFSFRQAEHVVFKLKPGFDGDSYQEYFTIWIDYNQDGLFDEIEELAYDAEGTTNITKLDTFKVAADALLGFTRMRVVMSFDNFAGACDAEDFNYGEIEDYCVFIDEISSTVDTQKNPFNVFPNPFNEELTINGLKENDIVKVYNIAGQLLYDQTNERGIEQIDLSFLSSGMYMICIENSNGSWSEKVIKM